MATGLQPRMVFSNVDRAADRLKQRRDTKLQATVRPRLLLDREHAAELRLRGRQAGLQASYRFLFAEAMRNRNDEGLRGHAEL